MASKLTVGVLAVIVASLATSSCSHEPEPSSACALFPELKAKAEIEYSGAPGAETLMVSIVNYGEGPLCFFARDRLFASELNVHDGHGAYVEIHYPDTDRPWSHPLSNRLICIPPGSMPVKQDFEVKLGQDIKPLPRGDHRLSFRLIAFGPYLLAMTKPDHSLGNEVKESDMSCGRDRAFAQLRADASVHID